MASAGDLCKFKVSNSKIGKCICVYIILTLFYRGLRPRYPPSLRHFSFKTGFSICHSFLDFRYRVPFAPPYGELDYPGAYSPPKYPLQDYAL